MNLGQTSHFIQSPYQPGNSSRNMRQSYMLKILEMQNLCFKYLWLIRSFAFFNDGEIISLDRQIRCLELFEPSFLMYDFRLFLKGKIRFTFLTHVDDIRQTRRSFWKCFHDWNTLVIVLKSNYVIEFCKESSRNRQCWIFLGLRNSPDLSNFMIELCKDSQGNPLMCETICKSENLWYLW